jgi:hypothetical protein
MKKLFVFLTVLIVGTIGLLAQDIPPPESIVEWIGALPIYLGSWPGVAISFIPLVAIVLGALNLNEASKFVKYLITGLVGAILLLLAFFVPFGYLNGAYWWWIPVNWVGLMLLQVLGYALIGELLDKVAEKFNPWKPKE